MNLVRLLGGAVALAAALAVVPALAQRTLPLAPPPNDPALGECHPYPEIVDALKSSYGEVTTGRNLVDATGTAVEVFVGEATLSVVEVFPDNTACYRSFGGQWHKDEAQPPGRRPP